MSVQSAQIIQTAGIKLVNSNELYPALHQPGDAGLPMLVVENEQARAVIALQGAHLMAFQPKNEPEMFWVSPKCVLEAGKPIRGGIPLCLPWFGPGPDGKLLPHGFARISEWKLASAEVQENGATGLVLELAGNAGFCDLWPHAFAFRLEIVVGQQLELQLTAQNCGANPAPFAFAYHTYFAVPNVAEAEVGGLSGVTYIDKMDNFTQKVCEGDVTISGGTDCVYLDVPEQQTVKTAASTVKIASEAKCAVVWNAWTNDKNIFDLGEGNHVGYICVERGDVADYALTLQPGDTYKAKMTLSY